VKPALAIVLTLAGLSAGQGKHTFAGVITDSECANGDHSHMRMGPTDAECVVACIEEHGGAYVLYDGRNAYGLSDQKAAAKFAARNVRVTGTLDAARKTIQVETIALSR